MKPIVFLFFCLLSCSITFAQKNDYIEATYSCSLSFDIDLFLNKIPVQERKEAEVYLKNSLDKGLILDYSLESNDSISIFKLIPKINNSQNEGSLIVEEMLAFDKLPTYKFINKKEYLKEIDILGKKFIIKEAIPIIKWEIQEDVKYILSKKATKAIGYIGNNPVTAWFFNDILLDNGPYLLHGLPGLIAEAEFNINNVNQHYVINSMSNKNKKVKVKFSKKAKIVSSEEFRSEIKKLQQNAKEDRVDLD
ncbi:MAG: GLPGLI family protein [Cetobacterium sp.]|uniref:GLPGLI family protein n=1 Tax=Cetobacterium sp. TaxID=2071632 RepID=UPI003F3BF39F